MEPIAQPPEEPADSRFPVAQPPSGPEDNAETAPALPRRRFLRLAAWIGVVAGAGLGLAATRRSTSLPTSFGSPTPSISVVPPPPLPAVAEPLPAIPADPAQVAQGLSPLFTPTADFYRIDVAFEVPQISLDTWTLRIDGSVDAPLQLSYNELLSMPLVEIDATLSCVSNPVNGHSIGTARWTGVRLADLLTQAGVAPGVEQIFTYGADRFTAGFPVDYSANPDALVAVGMNGEPLTAEHGFPARLVVPGLFGYVSATKWLSRIELTTWQQRSGYWIPRGWSRLGPMKPGSRFDVPMQGATLTTNVTTVAGMAWSATGVSKVEVRAGDGAWQRAELGERLPGASWRQWWTTMQLPTGLVRLTARCYDGDGVVQTEQIADVVPDGATGWPSVVVEVA